jgi:hypothetical protein
VFACLLALDDVQVMIEAIARQYITGSMWRDYGKGSREFCGIAIPDGNHSCSTLLFLLHFLTDIMPTITHLILVAW